MADVIPSPALTAASKGDLTGLFKFVLTKTLQNTDDMLPAKVLSYSRETNTATVLPLIKIVSTDKIATSRAQIKGIPVLQLGGGGFVLSFPIEAGDIGWIKANDRDISLFMKNKAEKEPNTGRLHSFSDAVFIPDTMFRSVSIASEDASSVVLQSLDGTQKVAISDSQVKITSADLIILSAPEIQITGALVGGSGASFTGTITSENDVIAKSGVSGETVSLLTHTHTGVTPGGGNTGEPNGT